MKKVKKADRIRERLEKARMQFLTEMIKALGAPHDAEKVTDILGMKKERQNEHP